MFIIWEWIVGAGLGLEYFEEEDAWILSFFFIRFIIFKDEPTE